MSGPTGRSFDGRYVHRYSIRAAKEEKNTYCSYCNRIILPMERQYLVAIEFDGPVGQANEENANACENCIEDTRRKLELASALIH